jgi:DNA-directed RNA polymerase specialized sigma24 family protein
MDRLPSRLREVAGERIYGEMSIAALAEKKGLTVAATKSRVSRAKKTVIHSLSKSTANRQRKSSGESSKCSCMCSEYDDEDPRDP